MRTIRAIGSSIPARVRRPRIWPFTGRTGGPSPSGASAALQAPAATTTAPHSISSPPAPRTPLTRPPAVSIAATSKPSSTSALARCQGGEHGTRVGGGVAVGEHAAGDPRREARLEVAAAAGRQPLGVEAERRVELVQAPQRLGVVAVGGHHERAALAKAGGQAAALLELGRERGPALAREQVHLQPGLLAEVRLGHRREHSRGHVRGAGARLAGAIDHEHGQAAPAGAPGASEADQAGADHDGVVACVPRQFNHSLRRHYPGQVRRSAAPQPPSQPGPSELPLVSQSYRCRRVATCASAKDWDPA